MFKCFFYLYSFDDMSFRAPWTNQSEMHSVSFIWNQTTCFGL